MNSSFSFFIQFPSFPCFYFLGVGNRTSLHGHLPAFAYQVLGFQARPPYPASFSLPFFPTMLGIKPRTQRGCYSATGLTLACIYYVHKSLDVAPPSLHAWKILIFQFTLARIPVCPLILQRKMATRRLYMEYENLGFTLPANTSTFEV